MGFNRAALPCFPCFVPLLPYGYSLTSRVSQTPRCCLHDSALSSSRWVAIETDGHGKVQAGGSSGKRTAIVECETGWLDSGCKIVDAFGHSHFVTSSMDAVVFMRGTHHHFYNFCFSTAVKLLDHIRNINLLDRNWNVERHLKVMPYIASDSSLEVNITLCVMSCKDIQLGWRKVIDFLWLIMFINWNYKLNLTALSFQFLVKGAVLCIFHAQSAIYSTIK